LQRIESGDQIVVGVNSYTTGEPSPLVSNLDGAILKVDGAAERAQIERLRAHRNTRNANDARDALTALRDAAKSGANVMETSIRCAHAGVTTGEWADALRAIFGEYRAPTGVGGQTSADGDGIGALRARVSEVASRLGHTPRILVGKPGLDGHSNGAEQIAVRARDVGMEVIYQGIRLTPQEIITTAQQEDVDVIGLSILSGSHMTLVPEIVEQLRAAGMGDVPVVVGGIIPEDDERQLRELGVAGVYTPKDYELSDVMSDILTLIDAARN
jgi:(2R)-ethylmalonyl-CoA mutase